MAFETVGSAVVIITADASDLDRDILDKVRRSAKAAGDDLERNLGTRLRQSGTQLREYGERVSSVGSTLSRLTVPFALAGGAALKMGFDFNQSMTQIVTLVGLSREEVNGMRDDVFKLSGATAKAPQELAEALYFVTSAGFAGKEAMEILAASAKASAIGLGETAVIADAVTSAVSAYASSGLTAAQATDAMAAAIRVGKIEANQLGPVIGRVVPVASQMGVSFQDVTAALAAMSRSGVDAAEGVTALRGFLGTLLKPSKQAEDALKEFGLSAAGLRENLREKGLLDTLRLLHTRIGDNDAAFAEIIPNVRALTGFLNLTGQDAKAVEEIFKATANSAGDVEKAFRELQKTPEFKFQKALAAVKVELTKVGADLLPKLVDALKQIDSDDLKSLGEAISSFVKAAISGIKTFIAIWEAIPKPLQGFIAKMLVMGAVLGPILKIFGTFTTLLGNISTLLAPLATKMGATAAAEAAMGAGGATGAAGVGLLSGALGVLGAALAGIVIGTMIYNQIEERIIKPIEKARQTIEDNVFSMQNRLIESLNKIGGVTSQNLAPVNQVLNEMRSNGELTSQAMFNLNQQAQLIGEALRLGLEPAPAALRAIAAGGDVGAAAIANLKGQVDLAKVGVDTLNQAQLDAIKGRANELAAALGIKTVGEAQKLQAKIIELNKQGFPVLGGSIDSIANRLGITAGQARGLKEWLNSIEGTYNAQVNINVSRTGDAVSGDMLSGLEFNHAGGIIRHIGGLIRHAGGTIDKELRALHTGGGFLPDERLVVGLTGEGVINRRGMRRIGEAGLNQINAPVGGAPPWASREDLFQMLQELMVAMRPITVNQVTQDPRVVAEAVAIRLGAQVRT